MKVRPTGILIEKNKILLLEQEVASDSKRKYSLPGGTLEEGETVYECLKREMLEETGLDVEPIRLLYICDRITPGVHVLHITFEVKRVGGELRQNGTSRDTRLIRSAEMVPIDSLKDYGFAEKFYNLVKENFPDAGTYRGDIKNIGL